MNPVFTNNNQGIDSNRSNPEENPFFQQQHTLEFSYSSSNNKDEVNVVEEDRVNDDVEKLTKNLKNIQLGKPSIKSLQSSHKRKAAQLVPSFRQSPN